MTRFVLLLLWLLCQLCNLIAAVEMLVSIVLGGRRAWELAKGYDQLGNVALGGDEDMLISARAWTRRHQWQWGMLVRLLDWIEPGHCRAALWSEMAKRKAPVGEY